MKKGLSLYLTFALLCVLAIVVCVAGCKDLKPVSGAPDGSTANDSENQNIGLITDVTFYDYDRTQVSNTVSTEGGDDVSDSTSSDESSEAGSESGSSAPTGSDGIKYNSDDSGWTTSRWY